MCHQHKAINKPDVMVIDNYISFGHSDFVRQTAALFLSPVRILPWLLGYVNFDDHHLRCFTSSVDDPRLWVTLMLYKYNCPLFQLLESLVPNLLHLLASPQQMGSPSLHHHQPGCKKNLLFLMWKMGMMITGVTWM
jgi:hypothetical protein